MSMRSRIAALMLGAAVVLAFGAAAGGAARANGPCTGSMLSGTFKTIPGSAGAGNISYKLVVHNSSTSACFVTGIPGVTLLDSRGKALPTHGSFAGPPGTLSAIMVALGPGQSAHLTASFSPDVPGPGEQTMGACEHTAYKLRVAPSGGGTVVAPITPPTPVCEHGALSLSVFTH
jgi:hypothetical protein